jgi:hypothetical protein
MTTVTTVKKALEEKKPFIYIGRPNRLVKEGFGADGYYGNPFKLSSESERQEIYDRFYEYAVERVGEEEEYRNRVAYLDGKTLACWCAPKLCHGHALAKVAASLVIPTLTLYEANKRLGAIHTFLLPSVDKLTPDRDILVGLAEEERSALIKRIDQIYREHPER